MGVVYEAVDSVIERTVAIKTIRKADLDPDEAAEHGRRFLIEAKAAGKLNHPNIVGLYDHGDEAGLAYLVMELVQGRELQHYFNERYPFTLADIVRLMGELLDALGYSHRRGVIHRDVKPANIFITESGHIKLGDFGIARIESSTKTRVGAVLGTPSHMAPEQIRGEGADARSDLYAAGVVLFQFLTGERPFTGPMLSMALKVLNEPAPVPSSIRSGVSGALDAVVARALAKQPADRYQSAADFWRALLEASGLASAGMVASGTLAGDGADTGSGRSGFGDTGFGRSGFGDTGFGDTAFGRGGFGGTGLGHGAPGDTATGALPRPGTTTTPPTLRPHGEAAMPPTPVSAGAAQPAADSTTAALPSATNAPPPAPPPPPAPTPAARSTPRLPPPAAAGEPAHHTSPSHPPAGRSATVVWVGAAALLVALGVGWWARRPATAPEPTHEAPARSDTTPSAPGPSASAITPPAAPPPPPPAASATLPAPAPAPEPKATATPSPVPPPAASSAAAPPPAAQGASSVPPPSPRPAPRPVRETRPGPPKAPTEAMASPPPKAARPPRCSDILQKASLEPLTSEEAAYLRRECQ